MSRIALILALSPLLLAAQVNRLGEALHAVVLVELHSQAHVSKQEYTTYGSGFFVGKHGYVLTSHHVVDASGTDDLGLPEARTVKSLRIRAKDHYYDARVIAIDPVQDLALLATVAKPNEYLAVNGDAKAKRGDQVHVFGFPDASEKKELRIKSAIVRRIHRQAGTPIMYQLDGALRPGNSGGPVLTSSGDLLGIAKAVAKEDALSSYVVPAGFAAKLMAPLKTGMDWPMTVEVAVQATPPGGVVVVDGEVRGTANCSLPLASGIRRIALHTPGQESEIGIRALTDNATLTYQLRPLPEFILTPPKTTIDLPSDFTPPEPGKKLLELDFTKPPAGAAVAGSWSVQAGALHNAHADHTMKTYLVGNADWQNYTVSAQISMPEQGDRARAGLVFRQSRRGFYCFRLLRNPSRVQLAWHNTLPYGWLVLDEKELDTPPATAFRLQVYAHNDNIACLLDGKLMLQAKSALSAGGAAGVYCADSRCAFDDVRVQETGGFAVPRLPTTHYSQFWFYDQFNFDSVWWQSADSKTAPPWIASAAGGVGNAGQPRAALLGKLRLREFKADLVFRLGSSGEGVIGFVFGADGEERHELLIDERRRQALLQKRTANDVEVLATTPVNFLLNLDTPGDGHLLFGAPISRLVATLQGQTLVLVTPAGELFRHEFTNTVPSGRFGVLTGGVDACLQGLMLSDPRNGDE